MNFLRGVYDGILIVGLVILHLSHWITSPRIKFSLLDALILGVIISSDIYWVWGIGLYILWGMIEVVISHGLSKWILKIDPASNMD
jgi:hypothetical protein